jgi:flavin reductase (DIM6/NTAB) family NADH-FMN oxidoreductase RutF
MSGGERPRSGSYGGITSGAGSRIPSRTASTAPGGVAADASAMRAARRRWAGGVAVVTARDDDGVRGATATAFTVVSLDPPLLLVCLDRSGRMATAVPETGAFAVSILNRAQEFLADRFAGIGPLPDRRLTGIRHYVTASGCPILDASLAWFDCRVRDVHDGGSHVIVVGEIVTLGFGDDTDDPLLSYEGRYRGIEGA